MEGKMKRDRKRAHALISFHGLLCALMILLMPVSVQAEGESDFSVSRLSIAGSIENLEPVGVVNMFAASTEKVYCFLEATNIQTDTSVSFVWYHEEKKMATVTLPLNKGPKWRTYASKRLGGLKGAWKVELQDANANVIQTAGFTVE